MHYQQMTFAVESTDCVTDLWAIGVFVLATENSITVQCTADQVKAVREIVGCPEPEPE